MLFAHDTEMALQAAVALANSADDPDTMTTVEELRAFYDDYGYTGPHARDETDLEALRALRPELRRLLTSERDDAVTLVNAILAEERALPQLRRHDALDWHVHAEPPDSSLATQVRVETAMAMIDVIRADETSRLGTCADEGCDGVVLDLSRNRSRRFCSVACGNRNAVAAYRARQSGS